MPLLIAVLWLAVPAEANVRSVRTDAPGPGRFTPCVGIRPGHPPDAEAVRRAVELLHATGEFEEVVVEAERGSEGIDVVFRTRPAPLLAGARVVGDRVFSASALLKRTRLRRGEALWPARLERAGRDAALAFVAAGYLEAVVNVETQPGPAGAELGAPGSPRRAGPLPLRKAAVGSRPRLRGPGGPRRHRGQRPRRGHERAASRPRDPRGSPPRRAVPRGGRADDHASPRGPRIRRG